MANEDTPKSVFAEQVVYAVEHANHGDVVGAAAHLYNAFDAVIEMVDCQRCSICGKRVIGTDKTQVGAAVRHRECVEREEAEHRG